MRDGIELGWVAADYEREGVEVSDAPLKMRPGALAILVGLTDGTTHAVVLTKDEMEYVLGLLVQLHDGSIKLGPTTYDSIEIGARDG